MQTPKLTVFRFGLAGLFGLIICWSMVLGMSQWQRERHYAKTRDYERHLEEEIVGLCEIPGLRVAVSAQLNKDLTPKRATASILVPRGHYADIWRHRNSEPQDYSTPSLEELAWIETELISKIEDVVVSLLPEIEPTEDRYPLVKVKTYDDLRIGGVALMNRRGYGCHCRKRQCSSNRNLLPGSATCSTADLRPGSCVSTGTVAHANKLSHDAFRGITATSNGNRRTGENASGTQNVRGHFDWSTLR